VTPTERSRRNVLDPAAALVAGDSEVRHGLVPYNVLLLAGEPRWRTCALRSGITAGADVEVSGELWTVADVREAPDGGRATLVCIYAA
jgi:hypothetical protein